MIELVIKAIGIFILFAIILVLIAPFVMLAMYLFIGFLLMICRNLITLYEITVINRCLMCDRRIIPFATYCRECNNINKTVREVRRKNRAN